MRAPAGAGTDKGFLLLSIFWACMACVSARGVRHCVRLARASGFTPRGCLACVSAGDGNEMRPCGESFGAAGPPAGSPHCAPHFIPARLALCYNLLSSLREAALFRAASHLSVGPGRPDTSRAGLRTERERGDLRIRPRSGKGGSDG